MKKVLIIIAVIILIVAVVGGVSYVNNTHNSTKVDNSLNNQEVALDTVEDIKNLIDTVYETSKFEMSSLETNEIDVTDEMMLEAYTGLKSSDGVEAVLVSEPMISSIAYSLVCVKVTDNANIETIKSEMVNNIDLAKWICAEAELVYATNCGDVIFLVMSNEDNVTTISDTFKSLVNNNIGEELERKSESFDF